MKHNSHNPNVSSGLHKIKICNPLETKELNLTSTPQSQEKEGEGMKLEELIKVASEAYPDNLIEDIHNDEAAGGGGTLSHWHLV